MILVLCGFPLSGNSSQASYIYLNFWAFENPAPPRNSQSLLWGEYGYFLELHINCKAIRETNINNYHLMQTFLPFHWREPITWPANNCPHIMFSSCPMLSNCVWQRTVFCSCVNETKLFSFLWLLFCENGRLLSIHEFIYWKTNLVM